MLCINGQVSNKVDSLIKSSINVTLTSSPLDIAALNSDISVEAVFIDEPNDIRRRTLAFMYFECNLTGLISVVCRGSFRYNLGVEDDCCGFWVVVLTFFIFSSIALWRFFILSTEYASEEEEEEVYDDVVPKLGGVISDKLPL